MKYYLFQAVSARCSWVTLCRKFQQKIIQQSNWPHKRVKPIWFLKKKLSLTKLFPRNCHSKKLIAYWILGNNKNTLTGLANCKKTTRHHACLSLCAKSKKTNDAKSTKWPKTSIWAIFWRFRSQISPNCKLFSKIGFFQIEGHI